MSGKALLRAVLLCVGINGFIMVSLGIILLVLQYPMTFLTIGLIVFGTGQLVVFCYPNQEKRVITNIILLNLAMVFFMMSGLISYLQTEIFFRVAGIVCFSLGLMLIAACSVLLTVWIISETDPRKQETLYRDFKNRVLEDILKQLFE